MSPVDDRRPTSLHDPVIDEETGSAHSREEPGIALCLSGGGYRAMLFHLGALWRLSELGYLKRLKRVSSVSGGSITAGVLGVHWNYLGFDANGVAANFKEKVVGPVRKMASTTVDRKAIFTGVLGPGSVSEKVAAAYRKVLFGDRTLQDLPDEPRFVINATNVQSGVLWRFMKPYMRDYRVGEVRSPRVPLASAVAASSAFPPVLSPFEMELDPAQFTPNSGQDLQKEPYTSTVVLTDGGVYDNLGLETAWKRYDTILVSDGGGQMAPDPDPKRDWAGHALRIMGIIDNQVRSLRERQIIDALKSGRKKGAFWGIRTNVDDYGVGHLDAPHAKTMDLAATPTRLKMLDDRVQERLINWGYAVCDAAMRRYVDRGLPAAAAFPYPEANV